MSKELVLVLGGVRSGKSNFAQELAKSKGGNVLFVATAQAGDPDMADRIARHKASRPKDWRTVEEPLELASVLEGEASSADTVIVDCLTVWLSNMLLREDGTQEDEVMEQVNGLANAYEKGAASYILVSGEVGMGVVPAYPVARLFRDIHGRMNQRLARKADKVFMTVAGIPVELKPLGMQWGDIASGEDPNG
jgi:adenosylcobinamide kinase/adenosylcobinamide-phosphate guanylyltransferase